MMLVVIGTDYIGTYKSNYHTITTTTDPPIFRYQYTSDIILFNKVLIAFENLSIDKMRRFLKIIVNSLNTNCKPESNVRVVKYKLHMRMRLVYYYQGVDNL